MCTLFANLYVLLTRGPHMVYMGTPYIFYIYMITCGWLGWHMASKVVQPNGSGTGLQDCAKGFASIKPSAAGHQ